MYQYLTIKNNRDQILILFTLQSFDDIIKLFITHCELELPSDQTDSEISLSRHNIYLFMRDRPIESDTSSKTQIKLSELITRKLIMYCIYCSDVDFLREICTGHSKNIFERDRESYFSNIISAGSASIFEFILTNMDLSQSTLDELCEYIVELDNTTCLIILLNTNYQPSIDSIKYAIQYLSRGAIKIFLEENYMVQLAFDSIAFYNPVANDPISFIEEELRVFTDFQMIKLLVEHNIDISNKINDLLLHAIQSNILDLAMMCLESECDINTALKVGCINNNLEMMEHLLQLGADINVINGDDFAYIKLPSIKFLIQYKFIFNVEDISKVFHLILFSDCMVADIEYMLDIGANFDKIFMTERIVSERSWFEFIVWKNKFDIMKFLATRYLDYLLPELNRLFLVSVVCDKVDIMEYILSLGANIDPDYSKQAFILACWYGHLGVVTHLLDKGVDINSIEDHLFTLIAKKKNSRVFNGRERYDTYINKYIPLRYYGAVVGNQHLQILKLLIGYGFYIPNDNIFKS